MSAVRRVHEDSAARPGNLLPESSTFRAADITVGFSQGFPSRLLACKGREEWECIKLNSTHGAEDHKK
jgi:hypothetical protein